MAEVDSGNSALDQQLKNWLEWDKKGSESFLKIQKMIADKEWQQLDNIMTQRVSFGTAGIRGVMEPGFARMNDLVIIQTTQGLAHYVLECNPQARESGVVIGNDARFNSSRWAKLTAGVFLRLGFKVYLFSGITPTPFIPFSVQQKKTSVGIVITASHNPKDDNGYKVYWSNGPQIKPPHDKNIQKSILNHLKPECDAAFDEDLSEFDGSLLFDPHDELCSEYYTMLKNLLTDEDRNRKFIGRIVYTPMHGVGADYIDRAFEVAAFLPVLHVKEQREPDPTFPTVPFPNPEEGKSALNLSIATAERYNQENSDDIKSGVKGRSIHILANDPDADRLAVAELGSNGWHIFNGNEIGALLGWWQLQNYISRNPNQVDKSKLFYIASTVSSKILRSIARKEGLTFEETLTGFKWMANRAYDLEASGDAEVLLAYEEAIGFMCGTQVFDKDGVFSAIRMAELIAFLDTKNMTLQDKLKDLYETYGYHCSHNSYFINHNQEVTQNIFGRLRSFKDGQPNTYADKLGDKFSIVSVRDLTTGYDSTQPDHRAILPIDPKTQMITFQFDNGIVATLRTSGTEPKLKYYVEYCGDPEQKDWNSMERQLEDFVAIFIQEFLEPEKHGLIPRSN